MTETDTENIRFVSIHWVTILIYLFFFTFLQSSGDSCLTSNNCDPGKLCVNLHNTNPVCIPDICTYYTTTLHVHGIHVYVLGVRKKNKTKEVDQLYTEKP